MKYFYVEGQEITVWKDGTHICIKTETKFSDAVEMRDESAFSLAEILFGLLTPPKKLIIDDEHYRAWLMGRWPKESSSQTIKEAKFVGIGGSIWAWHDGSCVLLEPDVASNEPIKLTEYQAFELARTLLGLVRPALMLVAEGDHYTVA